MLKSFKFDWKAVTVKEPRVVMRVIIWVLLLANLVAAVIAFKPFGGSADDLRRETEALRSQLVRAEANLANSKQIVDKVQMARTQSDQFLTKYVVDRRVMSSAILEELGKLATEAGIKAGQQSNSLEPVEGSDTMSMLTISADFSGSYTSLAKLMNLLDRSPRFFIIENMTVSAPQGQGPQAPPPGQPGQPPLPGDKALNVTLRIDTFVRDESGEAL
ncbi:MAG TPA: hypothetical protein VGH38_30425 [Bryobacteraceae bacterium]|jgi:type IV pilus assembly protein PilO